MAGRLAGRYTNRNKARRPAPHELHRDVTCQTRTLAALGAVGTADVFHGRLLFLDGEVRLVKNLTDLNHVAFVGGAPLRPFHELFF